jgi:hypothetical protein
LEQPADRGLSSLVFVTPVSRAAEPCTKYTGQKSDASLSAGLASFAGYFCDEKLRDDAQNVFASQNLAGNELVLQNAKDSVNACIGLRSLQQANLSAYLKKMPPPAAGKASH